MMENHGQRQPAHTWLSQVVKSRLTHPLIGTWRVVFGASTRHQHPLAQCAWP